jgi:hypothetical protein
MHTLPAQQLADRVREIVAAFEKNPPKFIVDSRKEHFPWGWPPFELWPITAFAGGRDVAFLPAEERTVKDYDSLWASALQKRFGPDEARRYEVLAPLREYVRKNYQVAELQGYRRAETRLGLPTLVHELFDVHVVFVRK